MRLLLIFIYDTLQRKDLSLLVYYLVVITLETKSDCLHLTIRVVVVFSLRGMYDLNRLKKNHVLDSVPLLALFLSLIFS